MSVTTNITERQQSIIEEFSLFDDWMGKYEYLIEQGKALKPLDEAYKTEEHRVHGCQSQVWVRAYVKDGLIFYEGDSDALITKGLVALLIRVLSGQPPEDIATSRLEFIDDIGLREHLSPTRKNGLNGMIQQMKKFAILHSDTVRN